MKTFRQSGDWLSYTNSSGATITSGTPVVVGRRLAIVVADIANGASGAVKLRDGHSLAATSADVWSQGDELYWNAATSKLTDIPTGVFAGHAAADKASLATTATVILGRSVVPAQITDPGAGEAIPVTHDGSCELATAAGLSTPEEARTLADPVAVNQRLLLCLATHGTAGANGHCAITAAHAIDADSHTGISLQSEGASIELVGAKLGANLRWKIAWKDVTAVVSALLMMLALGWACATPAIAATPAGAVQATSGAKVIPAYSFAKYTDGNLDLATASTDDVVGVVEQATTAAGICSYVPAGMFATVGAGANIIRGQLVTCDANGDATPWTANAASNQTICGRALTSVADANMPAIRQTIRIQVLGGVSEQRRTITGSQSITGALTMNDPNLTATLGIISGQAATVTGLTVNGTSTLSGAVTMDDPNCTATLGVISGQAATVTGLTVNGTSTLSGPVTMDDPNCTATLGIISGQAATVTGLTVNGTSTLSGPVTMDDPNCTATLGVISGQAATVTGLTVNGTTQINGGMTTADSNLGVPHTVVKPLTVNTLPCIAVVWTVEANASGDTIYTVPAGNSLEVLDVYGYVNGASDDANNTVQLFNATNAISNAIPLNVADNTRVSATTLDNARTVVAPAGTLKVTFTKVDCAGVRLRVLLAPAR